MYMTTQHQFSKYLLGTYSVTGTEEAIPNVVGEDRETQRASWKRRHEGSVLKTEALRHESEMALSPSF